MLSKFEVKNFKNFKENYVFDLSNTKNFTFNSECVKNKVVNNAIIYGPNGIGKSNLSSALFDIISHLTDKQKALTKYANYLNMESDNEIAEFKYLFKFNNDTVEYHYGKKSLEDIVFEHLLFNGVIVISYDRRNVSNNMANINLVGAENLNRDLAQIKISVVKYVKNNTVLVEDTNYRILNKFVNFVDNMLLFRSLEDRYYQGFQVGSSNIHEYIINQGKLNDFEIFLNKAGIKCKLKSLEEGEQQKIVFVFGNKTLDYTTCCSTGTRALTLFYYWLLKISDPSREISLLFIDEFDAFYHYKLAEMVVQKIRGEKYQTILTTHNLSLMSNDLLRPDCYFLMYGSKMGSLSSYTSKELRLAHNIEKMYRAGAFNE